MIDERSYLAVLHEELVPAQGCTEPIALAYCSAQARKALGTDPENIRVLASGNIIKNVKSVVVPGTNGRRGIETAAVFGALAGDPEKKLEVLTGMPADRCRMAEEFLEHPEKCTVEHLKTDAKLHMIVEVCGGGHVVRAELKDRHTNIVRIEKYGESLSRGAELALKQYNEKNGTDYVIEIMDDKGDPKEAVNVANLIVSDPTVIAGMGSFSSSCAMAAAPVFEEADLLLFSPNASHTDFPAMGENMFSAVMSQKYEGAEFADALIEMFGAQNVAILYQNTDHGVIATDVFTKQYEAGGGKVIMSETFIPGQTKDFSPVLSRIKEQDPDLFYVNASYNDCAQIFMQAKALNMDCQLVGPGMLLTEEFLDVVGNKIDGTIVMSSVPAFLPSVLESGELDAASKNFVDSYTAEYNEVPDGFAASAFDAVNIVLDAVAKVGTDTPALREELKTLRDYPGVSGYNMSFNEQKEMVKGIYLFEIQDGQFVRVK